MAVDPSIGLETFVERVGEQGRIRDAPIEASDATRGIRALVSGAHRDVLHRRPSQLMQPVVLFDLDGLLIDSEPIWDAAKREVFGPLGLHLTTEMQAATRGMRQRDMVAYWFDRATIQADPDDVQQQIVAAVCRRLREGVAVKPGADHAVATCARASRAIAVVSSSPESVIRHALASAGLDRSFDAVFSAEDDEHGKPHPGAYLRAAAALGASPDECVVIEDSLNGVLAGVSAQMAVVAVPEAADRCDPRFAIATLVLESLKHLDTSVLGAAVSRGSRGAAWASRAALLGSGPPPGPPRQADLDARTDAAGTD
ncbi:HAD-IA family hydrolase [Micromonospora sp. NPDC004540]|uniref:HAD family hydrolase n=1 Tax=Micromonospora sp. NPDC004540 TaxID=3154457 RepID=UPI0033B8B6D4